MQVGARCHVVKNLRSKSLRTGNGITSKLNEPTTAFWWTLIHLRWVKELNFMLADEVSQVFIKLQQL